MTILSAINHLDKVKPNTYSQPEKIMWLSSLDGTVKTELMDTHEDGEAVVFEEYNEHTPLTQKLLIPAPYDEIYIFWLAAKIDYWNGDYGKYNNSIAMFNAAYANYAKYYNRIHAPVRKRFRFGGTPTSFAYQTATEVAAVSIKED